MPDTPYSQNDIARPLDRSPFARSPFEARRPDAEASQQLIDEMKRLREELRLLREEIRRN